MKYGTILASFLREVWALHPEKYADMRRFLVKKAAGEEIDTVEIEAAAASRRSSGVDVVAGGVAILPVFGVMSQRVGLLERASGGISTEGIGAQLEEASRNPDVKSILMIFDSPGGSVFGVEELAAKIRAVGSRKRVVGIADPVAASAAYWVLAQSAEVWVTPSGQVGSIGVIAGHEDWSQHDAQKGVKTTTVTSSPYKAEFSDVAPLSPEARAELQSKVDHYHGRFVSDVARGRRVPESVVQTRFGQGRMMTSSQAVAAGAADRVGTLEQVLGSLQGTSPSRSAAAVAEGAPLAAKLAALRARAVEVESNK